MASSGKYAVEGSLKRSKSLNVLRLGLCGLRLPCGFFVVADIFIKRTLPSIYVTVKRSEELMKLSIIVAC
jgi:hypothetical protein